jgi:hypothetical protein
MVVSFLVWVDEVEDRERQRKTKATSRWEVVERTREVEAACAT